MRSSSAAVGGLKIIDRGEADDKIVAVLEGDYVWGEAHEIGDLPYAHAAAVIRASIEDYRDNFGQQT